MVTDIQNQTSDVRTIRLKPEEEAVFDYVPGQFAFVQFYSEKLSSEEHHFTLTSTPEDDFLEFTIKESGDFTRQLGELRVGDRAKVEGPFGVFSLAGKEEPYVFVAGGIGITPVMSMLRYLRTQKEKPRAVLFYANRTQEDIAFRDEIEEMKSEEWLDAVFVLSEERADGCLHGYVDERVLESVLRDETVGSYFVVGPPPMMDAVQGVLLQRGVTKARIHTERFALR